MSQLFKDGQLYHQGKFQEKDFIVDDQGMIIIAESIDLDDFEEIIDCTGIHIIPGLIDCSIQRKSTDEKDLKGIIENASKGGITKLSHQKSIKGISFQEKEFILPIIPAATQDGKIQIDEFLSETYLFSSDEEKEANLKEIMEKIVQNEGVLFRCWKSTKELEKNLSLIKETGVQAHIEGIQTEADIVLIQQAKNQGVDVSASVYIEDLMMSENKESLLQGILSNTIEMVFSKENHTLSVMFGLFYTYFVKEKKISLEKVIDVMSFNIADIFGIEGGEVVNLEKTNLGFFNLAARHQIKEHNEEEFIGKWIMGVCCMTVVNGMISFRKGL